MSVRGVLPARFAVVVVIALLGVLGDAPGAAAAVPMAAATPFAPPGAVAATTRDLESKPDDTPPDTLIDSGPEGVTRDTTPTFELSSTEPGSTFECRIDEEPLADCTTPFTTAELSPGPHTFRAHAQDIATNFDPTPATRLFTVAPDPPTGHGPSAACHDTDGAFTVCPDGKDEWSDIAPGAFPETDAFLYADQADLVPDRGTPRSPVDTFMLLYDECGRRTPLKRDEFFVVSFDTTEHATGKPTRFVRYVIHVFGDGTLVMFENGELQHADGGATRVHEIDGQHAAAGFGPSPDCTQNHLVVEYDIELEAAGGHSYSPAPAWWSAHAPGGGSSTNPGTTCPRQIGTSASGGSSPWAAGLTTKPGTDVDKDGLDHADEIRLATDPCNHDTDDDGLIDSWEVQDPSVPGAGFDLDGNGRADVPSSLVFGKGFDAPNPLRKDVYVEVDSYDCMKGGCPPFDPMVHGLNAAAKTDVERMFASLNMSLHIIDDEHIKHFPNCDRPPNLNRGGSDSKFGTADQRALGFGDLIRAKELAFRYAVFAHSSRFDNDNPCATPFALSIVRSAVFGNPPLPDYDNTPFGSAVIGGRDMIVSLSPLWICPSDTEVPNPRFLLGIFIPANPFSKICSIPRDVANASIFPANVAGRALPPIKQPYARLLGATTEEGGATQLLGRSFAHLLGHLLGLDEADVANHPQTVQPQPPTLAYLLPEPYPGAAKIKLGGDQTTLLYTIDSSGPKLRFTPRVATGTTDEDNIDGNPITETAQTDTDGDGVIEDDDNCTGVVNPGQEDLDGDGQGDACDPDIDGDGVDNASDARPRDTDDDGIDNPADSDDDGDGIADAAPDNCPLIANAGQADVDGDGKGDVCDVDADGDGAEDGLERPTGSDPLDAASRPEYVGFEDSCSDGNDNDGDGMTDGADPGCVDSDGDTLPDSADPCPTVADSGWNDADGDGLGDACDPDADNDTVSNDDENRLGSDPIDASSTPEDRSIDGICSDGIDNDRDGLTDMDDPRCLLPSKLGPPAIRPGFDDVAFAANDDDSTGPVPLGFDIGFGGHTYSAAYVNNNGNLTFEGPLPDFVPFDLMDAPDPIVAPFFGDVDTRDGSLARYGTATVDGRPAFGVTWPGVGCFPRDTSKRNAFQALLVDRSDVAAGAFDIELDYDQIEWDRRSGACTEGGTTRPSGVRDAAVQAGAARAGYSDGTGANGAFAELDGSGVEDAFLDTNLTTGLIHAARDSTVLGRYVFKIRPPAPDSDGDGVGDEIDNCPDVANPAQQDSGLIGIGDACRPERHTTAGFLQARLDATTGVQPTSTLLADAPSMLDRLARMVADELANGQTDSAEKLTADLVESVVELGLVSAADAPQLRSDILDRVLGPRRPPPPPVIGPPLATPPPAAPLARDRIAPVLSGLSVVPRVFPTALGARTVVAARVRYRLSEAAHVRFDIQRPKAGRLAGGVCKPISHDLAAAPHCTRYKTVTLLGHNGLPGANARSFNGRAGRVALGPGRYRVAAIAKDAAGNRSPRRTAFFRITRR